MISRVADHCFWFGRYLDRAESTARLLESTRIMVFDAGIPVTQCWQPLVIVSGEMEQFTKRHGEAAVGDGEVVQRYMVWDEDNLVSLRRSIGAARENARVVRDTVAGEVWEEVNGLYHWIGDGTAERIYRDDREGFYRYVRRGIQLCLGLVRSTMLHDDPMSFLWLGVMLERVGQIARILDMHHHTMEQERAVHHGTAGEGVRTRKSSSFGKTDRTGKAAAPDVVDASAPAETIVEEALWLALLRACSGFDAFRKTHQGRVAVKDMVSFLVFEDRFPRSLRYCLRAARRLLGDIWPDGLWQRAEGRQEPEQLLDVLMTWLDGERSKLGSSSFHDILTRVVDDTTVVCRLISTEIGEGRVAPGAETEAAVANVPE